MMQKYKYLALAELKKENNYRNKLIEFYKKNDPLQLDTVDTTLKNFKGKEERIFQILEKRSKRLQRKQQQQQKNNNNNNNNNNSNNNINNNNNNQQPINQPTNQPNQLPKASPPAIN
jgi:hypothetical protein